MTSVTTSKSKNSESFYIAKSFVNNKGKSTSVNVRKLGTLKELLVEHGPTRDDVMKWAKEEARIETLKYKKEQQAKTVQITFHSDQKLDYNQQVVYRGGYLFPQTFYYRLQLDKTCRKLRDKYNFKYDINAVLSDLIYARILEPASKRSSYKTASEFLEKPSYQLYDIYRALDVLGNECDFIQSEVYKNSHLLGKRNDKILYYDCTNYYFETEQEDGDKKYGKSKEHRPSPIIQMGMFMDGDGIPIAFSLFPGNANEQTSLKPLEEKVLQDFGCTKFIYCSDAGLGSEAIKRINHAGERAFIVTQSIKKLNKDEPYTSHTLHQRLIVTYSPKYARYQKTIRDAQVERAEKMLSSGKVKKERRNPNDPARFIGKIAVTEDGEAAKIHNYLDADKIEQESLYDGMYAVTTDLLDDDVKDILKVSEGR